MPFQWRVNQLGSILRGRGVDKCTLIQSNCPSITTTREAVATSLGEAGISCTQHEMGDEEWPAAQTVDAMVRDARESGAQACVGVGADGVLDAAKATSLLTGLPASAAAEDFLRDA